MTKVERVEAWRTGLALPHADLERSGRSFHRTGTISTRGAAFATGPRQGERGPVALAAAVWVATPASSCDAVAVASPRPGGHPGESVYLAAR